MKERPLICNREMVKAILDGRKTQTRRPIQPQPHKSLKLIGMSFNWKEKAQAEFLTPTGYHPSLMYHPLCPYGQSWDRLWVRETWAYHIPPGAEKITSQNILYRADDEYKNDPIISKWKPSIHMPRWASRITLKITDVKVERLQEIMEENAISEGMKRWYPDKDEFEHLFTAKWYWEHIIKKRCRQSSVWDCPIKAFRELWDDIYPKKPEYQWAENPFCWVIEFITNI